MTSQIVHYTPTIAVMQSLKAANERIAELEASLRRINALIDNPARFSRDIQNVLDAAIDTSDHKF